MCFPSQPPQQQYEINLRAPRSGDINLEWNRMQNIDVNELLNRKHHKTKELGCASLVGEVAKIIENKISQGNKSYKFGDMTFVLQGSDIIAALGFNSSYKSIIEEMQNNATATKETAEQILKNLSKGRIDPDEKGIFHLDELENEIFEGLNNFTKKLMAVLICETIRFGDDGACVRMSMRIVISNFLKNREAPFEDVFVGNSDNGQSPLAIFAVKGGKQRMINQIMGYDSAYRKDSFFEQNKKILEKNKNFISDDEDEDGSSSSFSLNTFSPSIHQMQTRNKGEHSQGFYEDPSSSAVPSPARRQSNSVRTSGNFSEHADMSSQNQNYPISYFCEKCKLFYSGVKNQNECPICGKNVKEIPYTNLKVFIDSINSWEKADLLLPFEGYFIDLSED